MNNFKKYFTNLPHYVIIITWTLLIYNLKLKLFILITLVDLAALLTDFSYTNCLSNVDALDRLRVHLNIILLFNLCRLLTGDILSAHLWRHQVVGWEVRWERYWASSPRHERSVLVIHSLSSWCQAFTGFLDIRSYYLEVPAVMKILKFLKLHGCP